MSEDLAGAIGASPEELPPSGVPLTEPELPSPRSAAAKKAWAARKAANRQRGVAEPPDAAELEAAPPIGRSRDRGPGTRPRGKQSRGEAGPEPKAPAFRAGPIAKGMNSLYARAGKIVRVWDAAVGGAMIEMTRKVSDEDVTVGEAWEELARTNPRVRTFLMRLIEGGAWGQLFMAHLPLVVAVVMKDGVRSRLPFGKVLADVLVDDEEGPAPFPSGLTQEDLEQAMAMAASQFGLVMDGRAPEMPRMPTVANGDGTVGI